MHPTGIDETIMSTLSKDDLSRQARQAMSRFDWETVKRMADQIIDDDKSSAEGLYLRGMAQKGQRQFKEARKSFQQALAADERRYDAAMEIAALFSSMRRNGEAFALLDKYEGDLQNSPRYLDHAATTFVGIGMPERALPLYEKAHELQPEIELFRANLASCMVYAGEIDRARALYEGLLANNPGHRKNHYHLSRLIKATDDSHIRHMQQLLADRSVPDNRNTPLFFALGKEYEDLGQWEESFAWYKRGNETASRQMNYQPADDLALIDRIMETCTAEWLQDSVPVIAKEGRQTPIFITGLPRTGTTLVERILSSHSQVSSVGETMFLQMSLKANAGIARETPVGPDNIGPMASAQQSNVPDLYVEALSYRMGPEPFFIEKLPFNFLYLGLIAKYWPDAKLVVLNRNPVDACFSMYKQVFTWAYKFSYSLDFLGQYYVAHDRLLQRWRNVLGDRLIEIQYEELVDEQEVQTRSLLQKLDLAFEPACLTFEKNASHSTTASSVQVRSGISRASVDKWRNYETQLAPLLEILRNHNIRIA